MESSRGGPLTTFIMMLPLIVVPALAMLRAPDQDGSLLGRLLSAASAEDEETAVDSEDPTPEESLFDEMPGVEFGEFAETSPSDDLDALDAELFAEASNVPDAQPSATPAPFNPATAQFQSNAAPATVTNSTANDPAQTSQLLLQLQQMGASRTMWFNPGGNQTVGFVAFFQASQGIISYRFESIAATQTEAVQNVLNQAKAWQSEQNR